MTVSYCGTCHRMVGISCACGVSIAEKIRSLQLHPNCTPSREKRKYWDQEALNQTFGEDATERSLELTQGRGLNGKASLAELFD